MEGLCLLKREDLEAMYRKIAAEAKQGEKLPQDKGRKLNQTQLAQLLGRTVQTVMRYKEQGMPYYGSRNGQFFYENEVLEWLKEKNRKVNP